MNAYTQLPAPSAAPSHIGFLLLDDFSLISLASALEPLRLANELSGTGLYRWCTLTLNGAPVVAGNGMQVAPETALVREPALDALILCGGDGPPRVCDPALLARLRRIAEAGVHLGALGSASWVLAQAGLLHGYTCSPSWACRAELAEHFPGITLSAQPFVVDRDRYTAAGGGAALEMILQLLGLSHGTTLLAAVSESLSFGQLRPSLAPLPSLGDGCGGGRSKLQEVIGRMEANLQEPIELDELAEVIQLSRRHLERLFRKYLRCSPSRYYMRLRLLRARQLLRQTELPVVQVAANCGFHSAQTFSKSYREHFGMPPSGERVDRSLLCRAAMH